ncbi:MAG: pyridoxal phosphate-dependent aminotransferase [Thermoplasmatota archaeon]
MPRGEITPFAPRTEEAWSRIWNQSPDQATLGFRQAVAREYGLPLEEIMATSGASEADFLAVLALAGPGARVLVEKPAYFALLEPGHALGCTVDRVERRDTAGFRLRAEDIERALRPDTKLILLARPNNPTGAREDEATVCAIADAAARVGAWVVIDEVFAEATEAGAKPARLIHERVLSINSLTKCMGYSPLRAGWIAAPVELRENLERAKAHVNPPNPIVEMHLAMEVLSARKEILDRTRATRKAGLGLVQEFVAKHPEFQLAVPDGGTTCAVRLPRARADDIQFAKAALKGASVLVAPGSFIEMPGWIRIGLVGKTDVLEQGLATLSRWLAT